ncbi:MAG: S9 family peptidase [Myxococcales bacterium]|nr:S9 family peptidase [Myxococcales bacterium]
MRSSLRSAWCTGGHRAAPPRRRALCGLVLLSLSGGTIGCGGSTGSAGDSPAVISAAIVSETTSGVADATPGEPMNETEVPEGGVVEVLFGHRVADPFRWLEERRPRTDAWIEEQTARTVAYQEAHDSPTRAARLRELLSIGSIGSIARAGQATFFERREGDAERPILFVIDTPGAAARPVVNPEDFGERSSIDYFVPSPSGRLLAVGVSQNGDERSTLHVIEVATGARRDAIPHAKWASLSWRHDESGFLYTRYPLEGEADWDPDAQDTYNRHLFEHTLGQPYESDALIMRAPEPTDFLGAALDEGDRWALIGNFRGWSQSELFLVDMASDVQTPHPLTPDSDAVWNGELHRDYIYAYTNDEAPHGKIVRVRTDEARDRRWEQIVPEAEGTIDSFSIAGDYLVVTYVEDIASRLRVFSLAGRPVPDVALPVDVGSIGAVATSHESSRIAFTFSSFFSPPAAYELTLPDGTATAIATVSADIDTSDLHVTREHATSRDGTPVNLFLVHRGELPRDGTAPVLLEGYGGFNVSLTPTFSRNALYWLERGGVYAVANIRGGGEFGEEWHRAGMLGSKQNVFDDFAAAIAHLTESGLSNPDRIAISGGSNGGLLMGAMITQVPDTFRAALTAVGLYDMVRYTQFPPAEIWISEYGDPAEPDAFEWLYAYSPYHNVPASFRAPSVLITTADSDTRVSWQHSTKFGARLQAANIGPNPVLFYMEHAQGHGAGTALDDLVRDYVRRYTFIETELGVVE